VRVAAPSSRRRIAFWLGIAALAILAVGVVWIAVTGLLARSQLQKVRAELPRLRQAVLDNRTADARRLAEEISDQAARAHALTTGPAWWVTANLPVLGSPLHTTRVVTAAADRIGGVVPTVVQLSDEVSRTHAADSSVDLGPIRRLAPQLHRAALAVRSTTAQVSAAGGSWFGPVSSARTSLLDQLTRVSGELDGADRAVRIAVPMLGGSGPRRYFIGFLNEAEARGVGGIPGAFAIATVDQGHVHFDHFGADTELTKVRAPVQLGAEFDALYGQDDPTGTFPNSDLSPDFRNAARIWAGMWQAKTGERIDGALALDPTALGYLLAVTGPAHLSNGTAVSSGDVAAVTQRVLYSRFGSGSKADDTARKRYVVDLAQAVATKLAGGGNAHALVRAVSRAASERRFVVWSADAAVERELLTADWAGALSPPPGRPFAGFVVNNAAGSKLDYYLDRSFTYRRSSCAAGAATATLRLTNTAPTGLPAYVTIRADDPAGKTRPGDERLLVTYYATRGARIRSITVDGRPVPFTRLTENGLPTATVDLELPRTATRALTVQLTEPAADGPVNVLRQPQVRPMSVNLEGEVCGRS
jgi:hypothetical protein